MATLPGYKRKRTALRKNFTKNYNQISKLLEEENADAERITAAIELMEPRVQEMFDLDEKIFDELIIQNENKKNLDEETDDQDAYRLKWIMLKKQVDKLYYDKKSTFGQNSRYESVNSCNGNEFQRKQSRKFNLPKLELKKFDGNIKNWLSFWGQFRRIDEDSELEDDDKFQYLLQAMEPGTSVREIVESFPPSGINYHHALEQLKSRFAREDLLIEIYVRELLGLVLLQAKQTNALSLTSLYDQLSAHIRSLESLGVTKERYSAFIFPMIESALPSDILKIWERSRSYQLDTQGSDKELSNLLEFLKREVESEQRVNMARTSFSDSKKIITIPEIPTAECLITNSRNQETKQCVFCDKSTHSSVECYKLQKMTIEQRKEILKKKKACTVCLKVGHFAKFCKAYTKCCLCLKRHSVILCPGKTEPVAGPSSESQNVNNNFTQVQSVTMLPTLLVSIKNGSKNETIRALFDRGAQRSYIKESIAKKLGFKPVSKELLSHSLFGGIQTKSEEHDVYNFFVENLEKTFNFNLFALSKSRICCDIPCVNLCDNKLSNLLKRHNVTLTDKGIDNLEIGLLIGADYFSTFMTNEFIRLDDNLTAYKTKLGWTLVGKQTSDFSRNTNNLTCNINTLFCSTDLDTFWSLETLGIKDPSESKSIAEKEAQILSDFENNIKINSEARYEVQLPWKPGYEDICSNFELDKNRLLSTTKRLQKCGKLSDYTNVFKEWNELGIIEKISESEEDRKLGHYLSHHAVINENRLTTKTRPVFNASAKDKNGKSINLCLEKGVNLIENIPRLLIKFRKGLIGVTADIAKAFLQISIIPDDRKYLKFLWWKDETATEIITYRHCRVVFGLTSSPFLLSATILHHLSTVKGEYEECAKEMSKSFYVDNCISSVNSEEEARKFMYDAKEIMSWAKFDLRQWVMSPLPINETGQSEVSVLGLTWNIESDELYCNVKVPSLENFNTYTKRTILSITQKIFDPIGFTSPVTLVPRLILQEMWRRKLDWDENVPEDLQKRFSKWYESLHYLKNIRIPRKMSKYVKDCKISLHTFCDACKDGYAACVFIRFEHTENVCVQLLLAKSRVAPLEKLTIPRLELMSALIATRLVKEIKKSLDFHIDREYYWTDSSVTLCWIKRELEWKTFIGNRVKEIRENSNPKDWYHISGTHNWADLASRGCDVKELLDLCWFEGPPWLLLTPENWPQSEVNVDEPQVSLELKKKSCNLLNVDESFLQRLSYFHKYTKIVRTVPWILRFFFNLKHPENKKKQEISYEEFEYAEKKIVLLIQEENKSLIENKCSNLKIFKDADDLIRVETKITYGNFPENTKKPYVLPSKHFIIRRMVEERHRQLQHAGVNILICDIRQRWWIIGLRVLVKSIISKCVLCRRFRSKCQKPDTAPLPVERMNSSAAFEVTGVDLAGPLYLRSGEKCWVVLYTCAVYRAVHLELTKSLTTEEFLMTLRRFIARRGRVKLIMSDNGTNFVGANNLFSNVDWNEVQRYSNIVRIKWKFNVPSAPWWGGFWERLIKILKDLLRRVLGKSSVTYEELETILCDCEAVMNSRPLTYIEDEKTSTLEPLTPMCFLHSLTTSDVSDLDLIDGQSLNCRLRYLKKLREECRQRFYKEYLTFLVQKKAQNLDTIKVGDVVLIETEENRLRWPLGLVEEIIKGRDGVPRVAKLKTASGIKVRPFQKLYNLEVSLLNDDKQTKTRYGRVIKVPSRLMF